MESLEINWENIWLSVKKGNKPIEQIQLPEIVDAPKKILAEHSAGM